MKADKTWGLMIEWHQWSFWCVPISQKGRKEATLQGVNGNQV